MTDESIFAAASALKTEAERQAYLDQVCAGNSELRAEVEALLKADAGAGSFLNHPIVGTDATIAMSAEHDTVDGGGGPVSLAFLQPCDTPGRIGRIDHYEVVEVVGQGGMGVVLRAMDTKLSRIVAVKIMAPELAANPQAVKRFLREATTAAAVHHDHVVTIHAVGDHHRPPYIVMQFIEGQTLQQKIDSEGALELKQILRIGSQMAAGLAAAHKHGLIHRDVKPANILLENGVERVKITDFGLARASDDLEMTQTGMIAGTPQYMSPEQAKGEPVDARTDLFSLGSVLYTMCTGRPGFRAETTMGVLKRVCEDTPRPIREVNAEIPAWLEAIVGKLLAKNPGDRFQSAAEVAELLSQHLAHEQNPAQIARPATVALPPAPFVRPAAAPHTDSPLPVVLLTVLLVIIGLPLLALVVGVGGYFFSHTSTVPRQQQQGVLTLRLADPRIEYVIDGYGPNQTAVTSVQLPLDAGPHHVWFKLDDLELDTGTFYVHEGGRHELELEISANKAQALWDGQPLLLNLVAGNPPPGTLLAGGSRTLPGKWPPTDAELHWLASGGESWQPLFNGQDLTGWQPHPAESTAWAVKDGVLVGRGTNSYLYSARGDYRDFWLRAEVKINAEGDGGLLVRMASPTEPEVAKSGYEVQIAGDPNHVSPTASVIAHGTVPATTTTTTGAGGSAVGSGKLIQPDQWFVLEVLATGGRLRVAIDNQLAVDYRDDDSPRTTGHIALQSFSEGTEISFRKMEIREQSAPRSGSLVLPGTWPASFTELAALNKSPDGWIQLFNGSSLSGWLAIPAEHWRVENGVIHGLGPDSYLFNRFDDFEDFHLAVEYRINAAGDSGILYRAPTPTKGGGHWGYTVTGPEAEVGLRDEPGFRSGAITLKDPLPRVLVESSLPPQASGEWTRFELIALNERVQILVNGKLITDYVDEERKFKRGHIALCSSMGNDILTNVEFRKVEIRRLPAADSADDGFVRLFNGLDLSGWVLQGRRQDRNPAAAWRAQDGLLWAVGGAGNSGSLRSEKSYENYTLKLKFRYPRRAAGDTQLFGDTGIVIHRQEADAALPPTGFKFALGRKWEGRALHVEIPENNSAETEVCPPPAWKPDGEWNELVISSSRGTIEAWINGDLAARLTNCQPAQGYIAIDAHGTPIDFRDIVIQPANPVDSAEVAALRELVVAKERDLEAAKAQFTKGTITPLGVKPAEAELLEAKIRLASAQDDHPAVVARLKELVAVITEEKSLTQQRIDAGVDPTSALNAVDARLAEAKARLAKTEAALPANK